MSKKSEEFFDISPNDILPNRLSANIFGWHLSVDIVIEPNFGKWQFGKMSKNALNFDILRTR